MSFSNATPFAALDVPMSDASGLNYVVAIVKATFEVLEDGRAVPAEQPAPIRVNEVVRDESNPHSSLRYPTDVAFEKVGTDVVVIGDALSPKPVTFAYVAVKVREVLVPLGVHGERVFYTRVGGVSIGPAAPFERKPITYEKAYGGMTADGSIVEKRNPAGVGVAKRPSDLVGRPAPQIEHPARPHTTARDAHPPVGFGAIRTHWSPRLEYAGTFDAVWEETRLPLMPVDFNVRYNNVAHPSLFFETALAAGDVISVVGMTLGGALMFTVPALPIVIRGRLDGSGIVEARPTIDMVLIEPERRRFELTLRKALPLGRGKDVLREIQVDLDGPIPSSR